MNGVSESEREREKERERERDRQTDRQTDRQRQRETERDAQLSPVERDISHHRRKNNLWKKILFNTKRKKLCTDLLITLLYIPHFFI